MPLVAGLRRPRKVLELRRALCGNIAFCWPEFALLASIRGPITNRKSLRSCFPIRSSVSSEVSLWPLCGGFDVDFVFSVSPRLRGEIWFRLSAKC
jgi:hypothetical protein